MTVRAQRRLTRPMAQPIRPRTQHCYPYPAFSAAAVLTNPACPTTAHSAATVTGWRKTIPFPNCWIRLTANWPEKGLKIQSTKAAV
ncbi:hypothetical protein C7N83_11650, partial [Neisseria iguanae]